MDWSEAGRAIAWIVVTIFGACLISTVCGLHADWVDNSGGRKGALYYACKAVGRGWRGDFENRAPSRLSR